MRNIQTSQDLLSPKDYLTIHGIYTKIYGMVNSLSTKSWAGSCEGSSCLRRLGGVLSSASGSMRSSCLLRLSWIRSTSGDGVYAVSVILLRFRPVCSSISSGIATLLSRSRLAFLCRRLRISVSSNSSRAVLVFFLRIFP